MNPLSIIDKREVFGKKIQNGQTRFETRFSITQKGLLALIDMAIRERFIAPYATQFFIPGIEPAMIVQN